jgi:hypothetical protein
MSEATLSTLAGWRQIATDTIGYRQVINTWASRGGWTGCHCRMVTIKTEDADEEGQLEGLDSIAEQPEW